MMEKNRRTGALRQGWRLFQAGRRVKQGASQYQQEGGGYDFRSLGYDFVQGILGRYIWPVRLAEIVLLVVLVLVGIGTVQLFLSDHPFMGIITLLIGLVLLGIWWLLRLVRRFVERQITRALHAFDRRVTQGVAQVSDWPNWYRNWRKHKKAI